MFCCEYSKIFEGFFIEYLRVSFWLWEKQADHPKLVKLYNNVKISFFSNFKKKTKNAASFKNHCWTNYARSFLQFKADIKYVWQDYSSKMLLLLEVFFIFFSKKYLWTEIVFNIRKINMTLLSFFSYLVNITRWLFLQIRTVKCQCSWYQYFGMIKRVWKRLLLN